MPEAYGLHEVRQLQRGANASAADALTVAYPTDSIGVPPGKVWTILQASYRPDAAETRTVWFEIYDSRTTVRFPIQNPASRALSTVIPFGMLTEGMELRLYPGDFLRACRDAATAGSAMLLQLRFVENDLPFYEHVELLNKPVQTARKHGQAFARGSLSIGGGGGSRPPGPSHEGGGGTAEPV